jgi:hypothetical protein
VRPAATLLLVSMMPLMTSVNDAGGNFLDGQQMANSIILPTPQIEHLVKKLIYGVN